MMEDAAREKLHSAERDVSWLRVGVIVLNTLVYVFLMDHAGTHPPLAYAVLAFANVYGFVVAFLQPYRRYPILLSAAFTVVTDGVLIALWIHATGGFESPFYVIWYASIAAVAFRFGPLPTVVGALVYGLAYLVVLALDDAFPGHAAATVVRVAYIFFVALAGALLSREATRQARAKVRMRDRARRLDRAVKDRTAELEANRRELERSLAQLQAAHGRLQELDELKTRFINSAAHELGTPLTPLKMQLHLLSQGRLGDLSPRQQQAVNVLERNLVRLEGLVQDVLDVARLQNDRLALRVAPVEMGALVRDAVESHQPLAETAGVALDVGIDGEAWVEGDAARLHQVLFNLLGNALKFTPRGGRVSVALSSTPDGAVLRMQDTGVGLSPDQIAALFRPFVQFHEGLDPRRAGTGLGLYVSHGIVARHGGTLAARSDGPGRGAVFTVHLPRQGARQAEQARQALAAAGAGNGSAGDRI